MTTAELDGRDASLSPNDRLLLERFRKGEQDAATQLYLRYAGRLQSLASAQTSPQLANRFDPEDVVQSVFRTFFRRVSSGLYDVPPGEELWSLLLVLALNKIRTMSKYHRAQKRDVRKTIGAEQLGDAGEPSQTGDETSLQILRFVIDDLLDNLPETNRSIVELRIQGHKADEIVRMTERSKRTVERVLQEFRLKLSQMIDVGTSEPRESQQDSRRDC